MTKLADLNKGFENLWIHVEKSSNAPQALLDFLMVKRNH
jgi:hypothetical protein